MYAASFENAIGGLLYLVSSKFRLAFRRSTTRCFSELGNSLRQRYAAFAVLSAFVKDHTLYTIIMIIVIRVLVWYISLEVHLFRKTVKLWILKLKFCVHWQAKRKFWHDHRRNFVGVTLPLYKRSVFIEFFSERVGSDQRSFFKDLPLHEPFVQRGANTHPESAADRTAASNWLDTLASMMGYTPYSVSMSNKDQRSGRDGTRLFHFNKDLQMDLQADPCLDHHMIKMVDVDYYVDINEYLRFGQPIGIYTFCPNKPAGVTDEQSWSTIEDVITNRVRGGSEYTHKLWDYNRDHLLIHGRKHSYLYLVESRSTGYTDRRLVFFNPIKKMHRIVRDELEETPISRRKLSLKNYNVTHYVKDSTTYVAISKFGSELVTSFPAKAAITACSRMSVAARGYQLSDLQKILEVHQTAEEREASTSKTDSALAAALFIGCVNDNPDWDVGKIDALMALPKSDNFNYTITGPNFLHIPKNTARKCGPRFGRAYAPTRHPDNDLAMIDGRINRVGDRGTKVPTFYAQTCLTEFLKFLVPTPHLLTPYTVDEAEAYMSRPSQRALAERARPTMDLVEVTVDSFQKGETYVDPGFPRSISNCSAGHKINLSCFSYPLAENVLKPTHWYAFGKDPVALTQYVKEKTMDLDYIDLTDISKMDGSVNMFSDFMFKAVMLRAFHKDWHTHLAQLLTSENNAKIFTAFSQKYNSRFNTLSGSPITTGRNTCITAFCYYCALRKEGYEADVAWNLLGAFGGDDGLQGHLSPGTAERVFKVFNLNLKVERVMRGDPVTFLGRTYMDPWFGSPCCIADVPRQLRKLHLTTAGKDVPLEVCLVRKAESMLVNDSKTPILTSWAHRVLRCYPNVSVSPYLHLLRLSDSWWTTFESVFTPPLTDSDLADCYSYVADSLGRTVSEVRELELRIESSTDEEFLAIDEDWMVQNLKAPLPYELDGMLQPATEPQVIVEPLPPGAPLTSKLVVDLVQSVNDAIANPMSRPPNQRPTSANTAGASNPRARYPGIAGLKRDQRGKDPVQCSSCISDSTDLTVPAQSQGPRAHSQHRAAVYRGNAKPTSQSCPRHSLSSAGPHAPLERPAVRKPPYTSADETSLSEQISSGLNPAQTARTFKRVDRRSPEPVAPSSLKPQSYGAHQRVEPASTRPKGNRGK